MAYEHRKTTAAEQEHSSKAAEQYRRWCMRYGATCSAAPPKTTCVDLLISPNLVQTFAAELATDAIFAPIVRGAGSPIGSLIDRHSSPILLQTHIPNFGPERQDATGAWRPRLPPRAEREADRLCIPEGSGLRARALRNCHGGTFRPA